MTTSRGLLRLRSRLITRCSLPARWRAHGCRFRSSCSAGAPSSATRTLGRIVIVGPSQSFEQLAEAIDAAFARWDLSHMHEFELPDGRRVGFPSDEYAPDLVWEDHAALKVAGELKPGQEFGYVFDFGDDWRHRLSGA